MIVIDANLLIYAYDSTSPDHPKALDWLETVLSSTELVGIPWQNIAAFLRILTNSGVYGSRYQPAQVLAIVDQWLALPHVRPLAPGTNHWRLLRQMLLAGEARGKLTTDAVLAAVTVEHGGTLYTADRDFARFPGLRWVNPLAVR